MKYSRILNAFVLLSIGALVAPESQRIVACSGSSGSVCTVTTTTCLKSMVMAKSTLGVVLLPPLTQVMFNVPINLFLIANNPAPGCGPCTSPVSPTSSKIDIELVSLSLQSITTATISTGDATMILPVASPAGTFNGYSVPITVPAGTATGTYQAVAKATVNFSDGSSITQRGATVVCLVDPAPGNPSVPRLDVQLITGPFPRMAGGDQHEAMYRVTNNDPTNYRNSDCLCHWQAGCMCGRRAQAKIRVFLPSRIPLATIFRLRLIRVPAFRCPAIPTLNRKS